MGSEMCIRDRYINTGVTTHLDTQQMRVQVSSAALRVFPPGVLKTGEAKN